MKWKVLCYLVEMKCVDSREFVTLFELIADCYYTVESLLESQNYIVRMRAEVRGIESE